MKSYTFFAQGEPKGQPRPRACIRGRRAGVYDPGTADEWKRQVKAAAKPYIDAQGKLSGPIRVRLTWFMPRPLAHWCIRGGQRSNELSIKAPKFHDKKPDTDNLEKAVLDALTDAGLWDDDCQVFDVHKIKYYSNKRGFAGCEISASEVEE